MILLLASKSSNWKQAWKVNAPNVRQDLRILKAKATKVKTHWTVLPLNTEKFNDVKVGPTEPQEKILRSTDQKNTFKWPKVVFKDFGQNFVQAGCVAIGQQKHELEVNSTWEEPSSTTQMLNHGAINLDASKKTLSC